MITAADALYVDASAAIKLFVEEDGSAMARSAVGAAGGLISSRLLSIEVVAGLKRRLEPAAADHAVVQWQILWNEHDVVELDEGLVDHAVLLAEAHSLGTLDAIHLASCLRVPAVPMFFATWDRVLWDAARGVGLRTLPQERP